MPSPVGEPNTINTRKMYMRRLWNNELWKERKVLQTWKGVWRLISENLWRNKRRRKQGILSWRKSKWWSNWNWKKEECRSKKKDEKQNGLTKSIYGLWWWEEDVNMCHKVAVSLILHFISHLVLTMTINLTLSTIPQIRHMTILLPIVINETSLMI